MDRATHHIYINSEARADIQWWWDFAQEGNGQAIIQSPTLITSSSIQLFTDASRVGIGAFYGGRWISMAWPLQVRDHINDINTRELIPIAAAVFAWGSHWANQQILLCAYNQNLLYIWSSGTSPNTNIDIMKLVPAIFLSVRALKSTFFFSISQDISTNAQTYYHDLKLQHSSVCTTRLINSPRRCQQRHGLS